MSVFHLFFSHFWVQPSCSPAADTLNDPNVMECDDKLVRFCEGDETEVND